MADTLNPKQIDHEVKVATRLARKIKRPRGVHGVTVQADEAYDGLPMLVVTVDMDDDLNPSDQRLDELIDFEKEIVKAIRHAELASWPSVRLVPREQRAR